MTTTSLCIVDTHAHLDMSAFAKDRGGVITRALNAGVGTIITVGTNLESSKKAIGLAEKHPQIFATVGFHPHDVAKIGKTHITNLTEIANHPRVVAIGEVGLDFYRNYSPREAQLQTLQWQLDLAAEYVKYLSEVWKLVALLLTVGIFAFLTSILKVLGGE